MCMHMQWNSTSFRSKSNSSSDTDVHLNEHSITMNKIEWEWYVPWQRMGLGTVEHQ